MAKQLGEILIERGIINDKQLKSAELYSRQSNVPLADAIVKFGFASENQVTIGLSKHFAIPYASKENGILNPEKEQKLQDIIPEKFAREKYYLKKENETCN